MLQYDFIDLEEGFELGVSEEQEANLLFGNLELLFPSCNFLLFFSEYLFSSSCSVGIGLPVYSTFKAIENRDQNEQHKWLTYWAAYGSFSLVEVFTDKLISWYV